MLKSLLSNKEKLIELANIPVSENCSAVILKKLPEKLGDPGKFPIPCDFNELKCKALADLGSSINLMTLSVWKELGLPELISTQMTLELANRDICTLKGIARDVFVPVRKFTFPADFVIVDYASDPRVPLILGRPFLRTARALIDVHGEEMILCDGNEILILNMRNDTSSYSNEPHQESINMIDIYNVSHEEIREDLFATNHPSGNPTSLVSSHTNLTSPEVNDDIFDPEEDIIENLLNLDKTKDLPPYHDNQSSGNPTPISEPETKSSSSSPTLISLEESDLIWEEFEAYLAKGPSFEPLYHMSPPPSHEPEIQTSLDIKSLQLIEKVKKLENKLRQKRKSEEIEDEENAEDLKALFVACITERKPKSTPTPTKILDFEEPAKSQVNTGSTPSAQVNTGSTPSVHINELRDLQAEVQASEKSKELHEIAEQEEEAAKEALATEFDYIQARLNADQIFAEKIQQEEKGALFY
ncbi:reverse transcriptase domain-containing protein [Tanacetum coccineum]